MVRVGVTPSLRRLVSSRETDPTTGSTNPDAVFPGEALTREMIVAGCRHRDGLDIGPESVTIELAGSRRRRLAGSAISAVLVGATLVWVGVGASRAPAVAGLPTGLRWALAAAALVVAAAGWRRFVAFGRGQPTLLAVRVEQSAVRLAWRHQGEVIEEELDLGDLREIRFAEGSDDNGPRFRAELGFEPAASPRLTVCLTGPRVPFVTRVIAWARPTVRVERCWYQEICRPGSGMFAPSQSRRGALMALAGVIGIAVAVPILVALVVA